MGQGMVSGTVVTWRKSVGDVVHRGEPIVEIETDKSNIELESPADGVLVAIAHDAGHEIPVGEAIAFSDTGDDK
jgi:pyruvate dehydrogenase E2 component (dihydrolipoamide acetyltransferase)